MTATLVLSEIWICPPMAFARFGQSDTPMQSFRWKKNNYEVRGTAETEIEPDTTFIVGPHGEISVDLATSNASEANIQFRETSDTGKEIWRPVCPFFELHGKLENSDGEVVHDGVLTQKLLQQAGYDLNDLVWTVGIGNRKAYHYTLSEGDKVEAEVSLKGNQHTKTELQGRSPQLAGQEPILAGGSFINLGFVQVIKPNDELNEIRLRITPGKGHIFAPTNTAERDLGALIPPNESQAEFLQGVYTILNPASPWASWTTQLSGQYDPRTNPPGLYAQEPNGTSLGFLDDSGDGLIKVVLPNKNTAEPPFTAFARYTTCPQDFQPDRRPFVSIADGLSDLVNREEVLAPSYVEGDNWALTEAEVADLMQRVKETMEASNIDQQNLRSLLENQGWQLQDDPTEPFTPVKPTIGKTLPLTQDGRDHHARFLAYQVFKEFASQRGDDFWNIVRDPTAPPAPYDRQMPAVMKGSDAAPMHLTQRQYYFLKNWLKEVRNETEEG